MATLKTFPHRLRREAKSTAYSVRCILQSSPAKLTCKAHLLKATYRRQPATCAPLRRSYRAPGRAPARIREINERRRKMMAAAPGISATQTCSGGAPAAGRSGQRAGPPRGAQQGGRLGAHGMIRTLRTMTRQTPLPHSSPPGCPDSCGSEHAMLSTQPAHQQQQQLLRCPTTTWSKVAYHEFTFVGPSLSVV